MVAAPFTFLGICALIDAGRTFVEYAKGTLDLSPYEIFEVE